ncbi:MAG: TetR/AcrR family transcriptional regulator [Boseongicola sp.]
MARRSDHTRDELTEMALDSARAIVIEKGISALSGRKVTARMGYTIGTLYQIFDGMDDLVEKVNARTLSALYDQCAPSAEVETVADRLRAFGVSFVDFVNAHSNEWDAVMSYPYGPDHKFTSSYDDQIHRLFGLMIDATQHLYDAEEEAEHAADMAVLWASLTGILSVSASERQVGGLTLKQMLDRLVQMYLNARR